MKPIPKRLSEPIALAGLVVALVVALPLLGVLAFATRGVLVAVAAVLVVVGVVLYAVSPAFRGWFNAQTEGELSVGGFRLATDVALHPAHSWARLEGGVAQIGADDLMQTVFGPVGAVDLPSAGRRVRRGEPLFTLRRGGRSLAVPSPVSGTVLGLNPALPLHPERLNENPFTDGWAVRVEADSPGQQRQSLLRGSAARTWFRGEVERLRTALVNIGEPAATLPDGGVLVKEVYRQIDDATWDRLARTFFSADSDEETETPRLGS